MTALPYKKRYLASLSPPAAAILEVQIEPLDLSCSSGNSYRSSFIPSNSCSTGSSPSSTPISPVVIEVVQPPPPPPVRTAADHFGCCNCPSYFNTEERLKAHQRRHKIKESGRYTCLECQKRFVQQSSLITHQRIHTGERPYQCKICQQTYGDLSTFTKHKRTHSGEKPYRCTFCHKRFSQSGNCLRHIRALHKERDCLLKSFLNKRQQ